MFNIFHIFFRDWKLCLPRCTLTEKGVEKLAESLRLPTVRPSDMFIECAKVNETSKVQIARLMNQNNVNVAWKMPFIGRNLPLFIPKASYFAPDKSCDHQEETNDALGKEGKSSTVRVPIPVRVINLTQSSSEQHQSTKVREKISKERSWAPGPDLASDETESDSGESNQSYLHSDDITD